MGHMNTRHYAGMFDDALLHFLNKLGYRTSWLRNRQQGWADVHLELDFKSEARENSLVLISSAVQKVGRTSLTAGHRMTDAESSELLSTMRSVTVYFDLQSRRPIELPEPVRQTASSGLFDEREIDE